MLTDAVLVDRVIAGFDDAFDELYRRHSSAAWRLGQAVTGNSHDAADAVSEAFARVLQAVRAGRLQDGDSFRSYLLTATRNAALDGIRRGKAQPAEDDFDALPAVGLAPEDHVQGAVDAALVAAAFRNLPERWRSVLWLTEVEGVTTKDAADQLGLTANGTAQLAVRARAGLRERFLQAHVNGDVSGRCRFTTEHLGAYVGGGISPRDLAKVDQHLADCAECRGRKEQLEDVGSTLRRIALPIPLVLAGMSADRVRHALAAASSTSGSGRLAQVTQLVKEPTPLMRRVVGASAAGVLALGVLSLGMTGANDTPIDGLTAPRARAAAAAPTPDAVVLPDAVISDSFVPVGSELFSGGALTAAPEPSSSGRVTFSAPEGAGTTREPAAAPGSPTAPAPTTRPSAPGTGPSAASSPNPTAPLCSLVAVTCGGATSPVPALPVGVGANVGGIQVGVGTGTDLPPAGIPPIDANLGGEQVGDGEAPAPTDPGAVVQVGPIGPVAVPLPVPVPALPGLGL